MTGTVTVLTGPSGVGKGTVVSRLVAEHPQVWLSVSVTTRQPRPGEIDHVTYHFIDDAAFDALIADDDLVEWATVHGTARYGTPRKPLAAAMAAGRSCLLELDLAGARQVRRRLPEATLVFLAPPDVTELERRLRSRGTETQPQVERRLETASTELAAVSEFDHVVENVSVDQSVADLVELMGLGPARPTTTQAKVSSDGSR